MRDTPSRLCFDNANASPSNGTSSPDNSNTVNNPGNTNNNDSGNTSSSVNSNVDQTQNDFEKSIASFPEDYKVHLRKLHASHPNWKFIAKETGVDWKLLSDGFISGFGSGLVVIVPALSEVPPLLFEKILPVISTQVAQT